MSEPRNLVVIVASGLRVDAFGEAGVWPIVTPHLDNLVSRGVAFSAVSASPGRRPALTSLFTGLHVRQHGVYDDQRDLPEILGWPARLREAGYFNVGIGCVGPIAGQLDEARIVNELDDPSARGCEYLRYATKIGLSLPVQAQRQHRLQRGPFGMAQGLDDPTHDVDSFIMNAAIQQLERMPRDRRWCLIVSLTGPGNDLPAPRPYAEAAASPRLTGHFMPVDMTTVEDLSWFDYPRSVLQQMNPEQAEAIRRHYLGRVGMLDAAIGHLRDALDRHAQSTSTWLVLAGDRGCHLGEHGLFGARSFLSADISTPLWILPPLGDPPRKLPDPPDDDLLISMVDLAPTICAIAQADPPDVWPGRSALPAVAGEAVGSPAVISEYRRRLMLESMRYKVMFDLDDQAPRMLFDMVEDQNEKRNLIDQPIAANVLDALRCELAETLLPLRAAGDRARL